MQPEPLTCSDPIRERLEPGEVAHWTGQPGRGIFIYTSDLMTIPFSLFWGVISILWTTGAIRSAFSGKLPLFIAVALLLLGVPCALTGFYTLVGRFIVDAYTRRKTWYALTDRRALIVTALSTRKTVSLSLATLFRIELAEHRDGTGTITFGRMPALTDFRRSRISLFRTRNGMPPSFDHIAGAKDVYRLVQQLRHPPAATPVQV